MLALRVRPNAKQLVEQGAADAVVQAMKLHPESKQVQVGMLEVYFFNSITVINNILHRKFKRSI